MSAMKFQYHDLYHQQFESLVVEICVELLGAGVQPFSTGKDGGRDARFDGTAQCFPSQTSPLAGRFVAQAKHTEAPCARFSDREFSGDGKSSAISEEIVRLKKLVDGNELEHYFLFANRRLAGTADEALRKRIRDEAGASTVELFGIERIELLLRKFPAIVRRADLAEANTPLRVTSEDLAEVILRFAEC